jgi:hypothetical protein
MLNAYDLQRVRADHAAACLVLANKFCQEPGNTYNKTFIFITLYSIHNHENVCTAIAQKTIQR